MLKPLDDEEEEEEDEEGNAAGPGPDAPSSGPDAANPGMSPCPGADGCLPMLSRLICRCGMGCTEKGCMVVPVVAVAARGRGGVPRRMCIACPPPAANPRGALMFIR